MRFTRNRFFRGGFLRAWLWSSAFRRKIESKLLKFHVRFVPKLDLEASHSVASNGGPLPSKKPRKLALLTLTLSVAMLGLYPVLVKVWISPTYEHAHGRFLGTAIYDAKGLFVGIVPGMMSHIGDYSSGARLPPEHKSLRIDSIPTTFWNVLVSLEGKHIGSWRSWYGVDWVALVKDTFKIVSGAGRRGVSSLAIQLARMLRYSYISNLLLAMNMACGQNLESIRSRQWFEPENRPLPLPGYPPGGSIAVKTEWFHMVEN